VSKSKTDLIEEMLDSMSSELGAELSECETTEFNGHSVVLVAARDIGVPGRRGVLYVDGLERAHADAVSILAVPKARAVSGQPHDNLRDNIGQAIKDVFDNYGLKVEGFDIHDAREIDLFTDAVMKVVESANSQPASPPAAEMDVNDLLNAMDDAGFTQRERNNDRFRAITLKLLATREAAPNAEAGLASAVATMKFAIETQMDDGFAFLENWFNGNFDACRREWPEAPDECYIGADPLFRPSQAAPC